MKCLAITVLFFFAASGAFACKFLPKPDEVNFANAKSVFRARVTQMQLVPMEPGEERGAAEVRYEVMEVFKGQPPQKVRVTDFDTNCALRILLGEEQVFFVDENLHVQQQTGSFSSGGINFLTRVNDIRALAHSSK
ncbi:MAG: hypothetical protein J0I77_11300 [Rudaea sp.]|uniref:hypothetical protein n=1 Tax=unclassified Rudaea TaxID=2627037 RepID=UPI0010F7F43E|nr:MULTISPECIES: hypothetical protein [unclassified Rudaea]MBN8886297.1 hypothetical protein [Rudaea sp.]MBR0344334.1 hypothetical protein [Rudaea sp.]